MSWCNQQQLLTLRVAFAVATTIGCVAALSQEAIATPHARSGEWRFNVSLDGKPIGFHRFELTERGTHRQLHSEARFNVKILFINAYRYVHDSRETWQGQCLSAIDAHTDDNGKLNAVAGTQRDTGFTLTGAGADLGGCVMTFAYWNPKILDATRLLNPQTGEYIPIDVTHVGAEALSVRGVTQLAEHYRLLGHAKLGQPMRIDLWYSTGMEWLALESTTKDGGRLRYQMQ